MVDTKELKEEDLEKITGAGDKSYSNFNLPRGIKIRDLYKGYQFEARCTSDACKNQTKVFEVIYYNIGPNDLAKAICRCLTCGLEPVIKEKY